MDTQFKRKKDAMSMEQQKNIQPRELFLQEVYAQQPYAHYRVKSLDGSYAPLAIDRIATALAWASSGHEQEINVPLVLNETLKNIFDGVTPAEISDAMIMATTAFIEHDSAYGSMASRLLFKKLFREVTGKSVEFADVSHEYAKSFKHAITFGMQAGLYDVRLADFDLDELAMSLVPERDHLFEYMGLRTLYERYFVKNETTHMRIELPQIFWMRVAMGLAIIETDKTRKAIEFYTAMSLLRYVPSTPTLLHSALKRPQLSSCFLTTVEDDLTHIFKCIGDNAQISKWSGGLANDWSNIRATGAYIKSIKTESQGVVPFLKIANDTTAAINRSGKRRSAGVVYLESWHLEIEDFLDLRRNTGDERRRTHDINTASWIPDLLIKRVMADGEWTLFSPHEVPDLHHLYGKAFEERYAYYEQKARNGEFEMHKVIPAAQLWRKMLSRLFETGHPWFTFKDPCNVRSPQDHVGVVHSSNLCTEITLNTSKDETAVCNLGSVNFARHIHNGVLDYDLLAQTVATAVRMLDNVIDINYYPTIEAQNANMRHRPVGLGVMGFQDALYKLDINFDDERALSLAHDTQEFIAYHAIFTSAQLAAQRGAYESYKGSKWDRNIFPQDTIALLEAERGMPIEVVWKENLDWASLRAYVQQHGMRNSNTMAIAPTATISNIAGSFPSIEPIYKNLYVKANMSGEFTVINKYLIDDLKKYNLWDQTMRDELKYYDGNIQVINRIPATIKAKYKEVFEIDPLWLIKITAARGVWIDQSQSHNVFMQGVSGKLLNDIYLAAWKSGLKTTYYLRTLGASQIEKSTLDAKKFGFTQKRTYDFVQAEQAVAESAAPAVQSVPEEAPVVGQACSLSQDPECDVCQ